MKIKSMLARLQNAIGQDDLIEKMVLVPEPKKPFSQRSCEGQPVNLIVGYDGSPKSHTALDIAFWIAHQTRLATNAQVTVQAVYVVEDNPNHQYPDTFGMDINQQTLDCQISRIGEVSRSVKLALAQPKLQMLMPQLQSKSVTRLKQADTILWQARSLAEEWEGTFKSHLLFGRIGTELRKIAEWETADILFLGCQSVHHPMIKTLGTNFPCVVLGIPSCIDE